MSANSDFHKNCAKLRDWAKRIKELNPGCIAEVESLKVDGQEYFDRLFWMPSQTVGMAHANILLPICGIDGFHLKYHGLDHILMLVTGRTGSWNNVVLAAAIVESESTDQVKWVLKLLVDQLGFWLNADTMLVISDRGPGIRAAIHDVLHKSHHMFCALHLLDNLEAHCRRKGMLLSDDAKLLFNTLKSAETLDEFQDAWQALHYINPQASQYLSTVGSGKGQERDDSECDEDEDEPERGELTDMNYALSTDERNRQRATWSYAYIRRLNEREGKQIRTFNQATSNLAEQQGRAHRKIREEDLLNMMNRLAEK